jgi:hypothetical protein
MVSKVDVEEHIVEYHAKKNSYKHDPKEEQ